MQNPRLTLRIEMFGNMIEELNHWHQACDDEDGDMEIEYCEQMFVDTLHAVKEMREWLLEDLNEYRRDCELDGIPVDLSYYRIEKQLKESTFSLIRT